MMIMVQTDLCLIASAIAISSDFGISFEAVAFSVLRPHPRACFLSVLPSPFFLSLAVNLDQKTLQLFPRYRVDCKAGNRLGRIKN